MKSEKKESAPALFLPYQVNWLNDSSQVKIWEKSRRIGATFVQSYEDVSDIINGRVPSVWFSSADESAAREYINYCRLWVKMFLHARQANEVLLEERKQPTVTQIIFANGGRITALSSNPKSFRSKGGKVVLDEFAHHDDDSELWKAAKPAVTWGYPMRILSTHNGKQSMFYRFIEKINNGELSWSLHRTDIFHAVEDGLLDRILKHAATTEERECWLDELRRSCYDDIVWQEEFCCMPVDEATALLPFDVLKKCVSPACTVTDDPRQLSGSSANRPLFLGVDIGRKHDLTVIIGIEYDNDSAIISFCQTLRGCSFAAQKEILYSLLEMRSVRNCVIDGTGLGMAFAEEAIKAFGGKVESLVFTQQTKEELVYNVKCYVEDRRLVLPDSAALLNDLHSIRRVITAAGNVVYEAVRTSSDGHGDRFWALAMALYAAKNAPAAPVIISGRRKNTAKLLKGYSRIK